MALNDDFVNKYITQGSANADAMGMGESAAAFVTGTVVASGVNLWNSLVAAPQLIGIDTRGAMLGTHDLLDKVDANWADYYTEHKDSIETASFLATALLPAGLAMKGMKALQAGKFGIYPEMITDAAQTARRSELMSMLQNGAKATKEYRTMKRDILWSDTGMQFAQAAGMEVAVLATLNQSPFMEDYIKDPVSNFGLSVLMGGALGTGIGQIILRSDLAKSIGGITADAVKASGFLKHTQAINTAGVDQFQRMTYAARDLRQVAEENNVWPPRSQQTKAFAAAMADQWEGKAGEIRDKNILGQGLKDILGAKDQFNKQAIQQANDLIQSPLIFGANTVDFASFNLKELNDLAGLKPGWVMKMRRELDGQVASLKDAWKQGFVPADQIDEVTKELRKQSYQRYSLLNRKPFEQDPNWAKLMGTPKEPGEGVIYYSPEHQVFANKKDVGQILHAVDAGFTNAMDNIQIGRLSDDARETLFARSHSTAFADAHYLNTLASVQKFPTYKGEIHIPSADLALQQAWLTRISNMGPSERIPKIFIADTTKETATTSQAILKEGAKELDLQEFRNYVMSHKEQRIHELNQQSAGLQEISIRTNTPTETIDAFLMHGGKLQDSGQTMIYTDASKMADYLSPSRKLLALTTNEKKAQSLALRHTDMSAKLDAQSIENANREILDAAMAESQSVYAKEMYNQMLARDESWGIIREAMSNVDNDTIGSVMFSSADHALRRLGRAGDEMFVMGQAMNNIAIQQSESQLKNVVAQIRVHTTSTIGNQEFNKVANLLAGLRGYRNIDEEGRLYQLIDPANPQYERMATNLPRKESLERKKQYVTDTDGRELFLTDGMKNILRSLSEVAKEQFAMKNTINRILGFKEMSDQGLHIPTFNPNNKFMSYIIDREATLPNERVRLLIGKDAETLAGMEKDWTTKFGGMKARYELVTKGSQRNYNYWRQRVDPIDMDFADSSMFHSGASAQFNIPVDDAYAQTVVNNLHNNFLYYGKKLQSIYLSDIMESLDMMSNVNQAFVKDQTLTQRMFAKDQPKDAALAVKNILLGNSQLDQSSTWQVVNNGFASMIDYTSQQIARPLESFAKVLEAKGKNVWYKLNGTSSGEVSYKALAGELESTGLKNPFQDFQQFIAWKGAKDTEFNDVVLPGTRRINTLTGAQEQADFSIIKNATDKEMFNQKMDQLRVAETARRLSVSPVQAEEYIKAGSALLTAAALRVFETGHAFVTAISWPILTLPNLYREFGTSSLGNGQPIVWPAKVIYDGIRFRHSDAGKGKIAQWISEGFGDNVVSEIGKLNNDISVGGKNITASINKALDSKLVHILSTPSEFAERESRLWALSVGYQAAKTALPGISEVAADSMAKAFLARSVGNYHAGQRPALFQGTLGVTIGLFQTYMLSWAQSLFRGIEDRSFKQVGSMMLSQAGMFGMSSLPGYDLFSQAIGAHFSDHHMDLTKGTYRAVPEPVADFIIHGLPATLGVGLYTRGDIQPRLPFSSNTPLDTIAAVNVARQFYASTSHAMGSALAAQGVPDKIRGILEGLSMQSLSRPLARIVELTPQLNQETGQVQALGSVTRDGNTVGTSQMVWSVPGVLSRLLASRSSEEQIKRDSLYLSSYYGALDSDNKKRTTEMMKISLRNGSLDGDKLDRIGAEYLRTGTAAGFRSALNEAIATTQGGIDYTLSRKLKKDDPMLQMVDTYY